MGYEVAGWIGAVLVLLAYWLVTTHGTSIGYHVMNLVGAGGLLLNTVYHLALPSASVNVVWIFIAVWGIWREVKALRSTGGKGDPAAPASPSM